MKSNENLVDDFMHAAYDSGYYSGRHEDGEPHHLKTIEKRGQLRDEVLARLDATPALRGAASEALDYITDMAGACECSEDYPNEYRCVQCQLRAALAGVQGE